MSLVINIKGKILVGESKGTETSFETTVLDAVTGLPWNCDCTFFPYQSGVMNYVFDMLPFIAPVSDFICFTSVSLNSIK